MKTSKFRKNIAMSGKELRGRRGEMVEGRMLRGTNSLLSAWEEEYAKMEEELLELTDLSVTSTTSLVVAKDVDPDEWARKCINLRIGMRLKAEEIKEAKAFRDEWFSSIEETEG